MARFALPHLAARLSSWIRHDGAVGNARAELELAARRINDAEDLIRRVDARQLVAPTARTAPPLGRAPSRAA